MKRCNKCKCLLLKEDFHKQSRNKEGLQPKCKYCAADFARERRKKYTRADIDRHTEASRKWRDKNRDHVRRHNFKDKLMRTYGLTVEEYAHMWNDQERGCKLCEAKTSTGKGFCVDHNHTTGEVRGILCHFCNVGLGHFRDNPKILMKAIHYLKEINSI